MKNRKACRAGRRGFTLIELLVVIAIIALLIGILLPALGQARRSAQAMVAGANARQVALGVAIYSASNDDYFPASYAYATDEEDSYSWRMEDQRQEHPNPQNGYIHWSYALFGNGEVPEEAFESPGAFNGGAPRTNPGADPNDWEDDQINAIGGSVGDALVTDKQVKRVAFMGNAAVFPRNKFNSTGFGAGESRRNVFVRGAQINSGSLTILLAEISDANGWRLLAAEEGGAGNTRWESKSHRSITPFALTQDGGEMTPDEQIYGYTGTPRSKPFRYPNPVYGDAVGATKTFIRDDELDAVQGVIISSPLNVVSRRHNGKGNFAYVDGHVELETLFDTIKKAKWGDRFYSLNGDTRVWMPDELEREGQWEAD
ncbi:MAG: prepilin-type N-terminal cleavage/methylation domain-containing protein [Phycisphaerales bacterium]